MRLVQLRPTYIRRVHSVRVFTVIISRKLQQPPLRNMLENMIHNRKIEEALIHKVLVASPLVLVFPCAPILEFIHAPTSQRILLVIKCTSYIYKKKKRQLISLKLRMENLSIASSLLRTRSY